MRRGARLYRELKLLTEHSNVVWEEDGHRTHQHWLDAMFAVSRYALSDSLLKYDVVQVYVGDRSGSRDSGAADDSQAVSGAQIVGIRISRIVRDSGIVGGSAIPGLSGPVGLVGGPNILRDDYVVGDVSYEEVYGYVNELMTGLKGALLERKDNGGLSGEPSISESSISVRYPLVGGRREQTFFNPGSECEELFDKFFSTLNDLCRDALRSNKVLFKERDSVTAKHADVCERVVLKMRELDDKV